MVKKARKDLNCIVNDSNARGVSTREREKAEYAVVVAKRVRKGADGVCVGFSSLLYVVTAKFTFRAVFDVYESKIEDTQGQQNRQWRHDWFLYMAPTLSFAKVS